MGGLGIYGTELPLERRLTIMSTGSIASGKSTFLSALHAALGYDREGIKIDKDKLIGSKTKVRSQATKRRLRGIFRTNATDRPDSLAVYAMLGNNQVYQAGFFAPGGHVNSESIPPVKTLNGLLYFVDLNLASDLVEILDKKKTIDWGGQEISLYAEDGNPHDALKELIKSIQIANSYNGWISDRKIVDGLKKFLGMNAEKVNTIDELAAALESRVKNVPAFGLPVKGNQFIDRSNIVTYKKEILGEVVESIINSHRITMSAGESCTPILGVATHKNTVYGKLPQQQEELITAVQQIFNKAIEKYSLYLKSHRLNGKTMGIDLTAVTGQKIKWHIVDLIKQKQVKIGAKFQFEYTKDLLNTKNMQVVQIAYEMIAKALQHRGVELEGLKVLTFSERKSELTAPYYLTR